jgi:hypothetical protein
MQSFANNVWMEITRREDIGADLKAPSAARSGGVTGSYKITDELGQLTLGTFTGPAGTLRQTADLTPAQRAILASLQIPHPKKIIQAAPAGPDQDRASS